MELKRFFKVISLGAALSFSAKNALAIDASGKLLLTGGVTQLEGSAGGGLTPWAFIGGYGTKDQIGANAFYTNVRISDYNLTSTGALIGLYDRAEISFAHQELDLQHVGKMLGLGTGFKIKQNILGVKVKVLGDGVLDQASWLPQISVGAQFKVNENGKIVESVGAQSASGTDLYVSATKLVLSQSFLYNATFRRTKANQMGLLGYGGNGNNNYHIQFEGSLAYLLHRTLALGVEYRNKPDNLKGLKEENWTDIFIAWAPCKNISITAAYAMLGNIAIKDHQNGIYSSIQIGF